MKVAGCVQRIGCEHVLAKSPVYSTHIFIYSSHFAEMCFTEDGKLRRDCLPTKEGIDVPNEKIIFFPAGPEHCLSRLHTGTTRARFD